MKFGGSSVASPASVRRVVEIVRSQTTRCCVVVSAHGDTTNRLERILKHAAHAETYFSWKAIKELREYHFSLAEELLSGADLDAVDSFLRDTFRDLHVRMLEVCDGERSLTAEDRAWALSLGEQISSRLLSAVLCHSGVSAQHVDARTLIQTSGDFCQARPRYWESYARIRRAIPALPESHAIVMGGFIGATVDGRTTLLGSGGSDLTATIVGAALNAREIQIWKDVDGMLTCDPRLKSGALLVKHLSYNEAATLARAGAKILHPDTVAPAERLRIPILLRNTFHPECEGTRIGPSAGPVFSGIKSIAWRRDLLLLNIAAGPQDLPLGVLAAKLKEQGAGVQVLNCSATRLSLVADQQTDFSAWQAAEMGCLQVSVKSDQVLMTLAGDNPGSSFEQVSQVLAGRAAVLSGGESCFYVVVDEADAYDCLNRIHAALFQNVDAKFFSPQSVAPNKERETRKLAPEQPQPRHLVPAVQELRLSR